MTTSTLNVSFNSVSQYAHVGWGYLLSTAPVLLFHIPLWITAPLVVIGAGIKEYWDAHGLETPEIAGSSWEDFAYWCVGVAAAIMVIR